MAYAIISLDTSALGYAGKGTACPTFLISSLASLADDAEILNAPDGSKYILAGAPATTGYINPGNHHWILPADTPILITEQPADHNTVDDAIDGAVSVVAYAQDGTAAYTCTYQWYSNNAEETAGAELLADATNASYTLPASLAEGTIYYYCDITANSNKTLQTRYAKVVVAAAPTP